MCEWLVSILKYWALDLLDRAIVVFSGLCVVSHFNFLVYFRRVSSVQVVLALPWRRRIRAGSFCGVFERDLFLWSFLGNGLWGLHGLPVVRRENTLGLSLSIVVVQIGSVNWRRFLRDGSFVREYHVVTLHRRPVSDCRIQRGLFRNSFLRWVALLDPWGSQWTPYWQSSIQPFQILFIFLLDFQLVVRGIWKRRNLAWLHV